MLNVIPRNPRRDPSPAARVETLRTLPPSATEYGLAVLENDPFSRLERFTTREQYNPKSVVGRGLGAFYRAAGLINQEFPLSSEVREAADLNRLLPMPRGHEPHFKEAMPESLAREVHRQRLEEIHREGVIARYEGDRSWLTTTAFNLLLYPGDPLQAATVFMPGVGQAKTAQVLGRIFGKKASALGGYAVGGATAGAMAESLIAASMAGLSTQDVDAMSLGEILQRTFYGAVFNAAFDVGIASAVGGVRAAAPVVVAAARDMAGRPAAGAQPPPPPPAGRPAPARPTRPPPETRRVLEDIDEEAPLRTTDPKGRTVEIRQKDGMWNVYVDGVIDNAWGTVGDAVRQANRAYGTTLAEPAPAAARSTTPPLNAEPPAARPPAPSEAPVARAGEVPPEALPTKAPAAEVTAGPATRAEPAAGATSPEVLASARAQIDEAATAAGRTDAPAPDWVRANADAAWELANRTGKVDTIRKMAEEGRLAKEIAAATGMDVNDVRVVRDRLGIEAAGPVGFTMGMDMPKMSATERHSATVAATAQILSDQPVHVVGPPPSAVPADLVPIVEALNDTPSASPDPNLEAVSGIAKAATAESASRPPSPRGEAGGEAGVAKAKALPTAKEDVTRQLLALDKDADPVWVEANAILIDSFFTTLAGRVGRDARELYAEANLTFEKVVTADGEYFQPAFHSSPHIFDEFTTDFMGKGEGHQSFGWGLYFSQLKGIYDHLRGTPRVLLEGLNTASLGYDARKLLQKILDDIDATFLNKGQKREISKKRILADIDYEIAAWEGIGRLDPTHPNYTYFVEGLREARALLEALPQDKVIMQKGRGGRTYEVDVPEDKELLMWDRPLAEQPEEIRAALDRVAAALPGFSAPRALVKTINANRQESLVPSEDATTGEEFYHSLENFVNNHRAADHLVISGMDFTRVPNYIQDAITNVVEKHWPDGTPFTKRQLQEAIVDSGRVGRESALQYIDELPAETFTARQTDLKRLIEEMADELDKPSNELRTPEFVSRLLWGEGIVGHKYLDQGSRAAGEGTYNFVIWDASRIRTLSYEQPQARGAISFKDGKTLMSLFEKADPSTIVHEAWHMFLNIFLEMAKKYPEELGRDLEVARKQFEFEGFEPGVKAHELWAASGERYVMTGKAPSEELKGVFKLFKKWLTEVYSKLKAKLPFINPEVRKLFDRLLAPRRDPFGTPFIKKAQGYGEAPEQAVAAVEEPAPTVVADVAAEATPAAEPSSVEAAGAPPEDLAPGPPISPLSSFTFRTRNGTQYEIIGGRTLRQAPDRRGLTEADQTIYISEADAKALRPLKIKKGAPTQLIQRPDGSWGLKHLSGEKAGTFEEELSIKAKDEPAEGLVPVGLTDNGNFAAIGSPIVEMTPPLKNDPELEALERAVADLGLTEAEAREMMADIEDYAAAQRRVPTVYQDAKQCLINGGLV